ncbi:hypothetical protein FHL15_005350 [Xylaria flabelliformis]|uniref:Uncharacterized protein n=1 Tax=Xylaria flabelliformis TaxID=2512241 RepID=A0A553I0E5_9PEZI|nr:hypothetical protein FHL15_005350 [Xylaria flabelliformis]
MPAQAIFRARYTDEEALAGLLFERFPTQGFQIKEETREIELAVTKDHYDTNPAQISQDVDNQAPSYTATSPNHDAVLPTIPRRAIRKTDWLIRYLMR